MKTIRTNTKKHKIFEYIYFNNPTYTDIVRFIVKMNGMEKYIHEYHRGYYAANILKWIEDGDIFKFEKRYTLSNNNPHIKYFLGKLIEKV